jgi:hypothetical protein
LGVVPLEADTDSQLPTLFTVATNVTVAPLVSIVRLCPGGALPPGSAENAREDGPTSSVFVWALIVSSRPSIRHASKAKPLKQSPTLVIGFQAPGLDYRAPSIASLPTATPEQVQS